jgi:MFS family permease
MASTLAIGPATSSAPSNGADTPASPESTTVVSRRDEVDSPRAWSVAIAAAGVTAIGFGTAYTFGAFFDAMAEDLDASRGSTAAVFGITLFLFFGFGAVSGPLSDRIGPRPLLVGGGALFVTGLLLTSRVENVWLGYLTYGVGVGLGAGAFITPMFSTVGGWFVRQRATALGVTAIGSGVGTLVLAPLAARLIDTRGWREAYVVLALIAAVLLTIASLVIRRPPVPPAPPARAHLMGTLRLNSFQAVFASALGESVGIFVAFAFVATFAKDNGISSRPAALLIGIIGASSIIGRLAMSRAVSRFGPVRLIQACLATQPIAYVVWLFAGGSYPMLVGFAVILGVSYGGYVALNPEMTAHLFGVAGLGGLIGLTFLAAGIGGLIGPPLAGLLADVSDGQVIPILTVIVVSTISAAIALRIPVDPVAGEQTD